MLLLLLLLRLQLLWLLLVWLLSCLYQKLSIAQLAARQTGGVQRSRLAGSRQAGTRAGTWWSSHVPLDVAAQRLLALGQLTHLPRLHGGQRQGGRRWIGKGGRDKREGRREEGDGHGSGAGRVVAYLGCARRPTWPQIPQSAATHRVFIGQVALLCRSLHRL